jgi:hypothetical protein
VYYWRTNAAAVAGVAVAVSVFAGALVVGESVRATLRDLVFRRLGETEQVLSGAVFFRESLVHELGEAAPAIALQGVLTNESSGRRKTRVEVWGVDEHFWRLNGFAPKALSARDALTSHALAEELRLRPGDAVQLTVEKPSAVPSESLHGRKEDSGRTTRLTFRGALPSEELGEFSLHPQQGAVHALFVPLSRLQRDLDQAGRVNLALLSKPISPADLKAKYRLEDLGIKLRPLDAQRGFAVESESTILSEALARTVVSVAR